ncbi:hypothetical protein MML48_6g00011920 [Holotrichia oblita]|uniref:Uncharacterized protein n=1 Tax=Holotrichia oblita TaxID=644536 RepID=A0ACB9SYE6_HOLOL|nr:hypothetical protein MML48_6g00011920 [Holotrichia oblita]
MENIFKGTEGQPQYGPLHREVGLAIQNISVERGEPLPGVSRKEVQRHISVRKNGKVPGADGIANTARTKSGDYHDDMNATNFLTWVTKQLVPNLPPRSVLVLDNASYHNVKIEKDPTSGTRKAEMIEWLMARNIYFDSTFTKPELYELIKKNKTETPQYKLDTLLASYGHSVLRLPPYHPELNPIEKIWAIVKNWVAARNVTFKLADVEALARKKFACITCEEWASVCNHVDKVVADYLEKEHLLDNITEELEFVVNTGESDTDEDLYDDDDSEDHANNSLL